MFPINQHLHAKKKSVAHKGTAVNVVEAIAYIQSVACTSDLIRHGGIHELLPTAIQCQ